MELLGLIFILGLFAWLGTTAVAIVMVVFGIIGIFTLIPEEKRPLIRSIIGGLLIAGSLLLLISI